MKKVSMFGLSFLAMIAVATMFFFNSCSKDECKDVVCLNGGTCVSGTCDCALGFEGSDCATEMRTKFLGSWTASDNCSQTGTIAYLVTITAGTSTNEVMITNFWDSFNAAAVATVSGNTITIANQEPDNDNFFISGQGTVSANTISWTYTIDDQNAVSTGTDACSSTWTK